MKPRTFRITIASVAAGLLAALLVMRQGACVDSGAPGVGNASEAVSVSGCACKGGTNNGVSCATNGSGTPCITGGGQCMKTVTNAICDPATNTCSGQVSQSVTCESDTTSMQDMCDPTDPDSCKPLQTYDAAPGGGSGSSCSNCTCEYTLYKYCNGTNTRVSGALGADGKSCDCALTVDGQYAYYWRQKTDCIDCQTHTSGCTAPTTTPPATKACNIQATYFIGCDAWEIQNGLCTGTACSNKCREQYSGTPMGDQFHEAVDTFSAVLTPLKWIKENIFD